MGALPLRLIALIYEMKNFKSAKKSINASKTVYSAKESWFNSELNTLNNLEIKLKFDCFAQMGAHPLRSIALIPEMKNFKSAKKKY